jgi:hypothetical protein
MAKSKSRTEIKCCVCNKFRVYKGGVIFWYKDKPICGDCYGKKAAKIRREES